MRDFKILRKPYNDEIIYKKGTITINPGVTVLVGCNGSGKSTLITMISDTLKENNIPYLKYDNLRDGGSTAKSRAMHRHNDVSLLATLFVSSEGEQITINLGTYAAQIGKFIKTNPDATELWILMDAIDSGLSIDSIEDIKTYLFKTILDTNQNKDVYIVVSANSYGLCEGEACFDVHNGKYITFANYDEYKQFILKSKSLKDKRYEKVNKQEVGN